MILSDLTELKNLNHMLRYACENFADRNFIEYKSGGGIKSKTYKDLKCDSDAFSSMLIRKGFESAHTAIIGPTSYEWITAFFGTADAGGAAVPLAANETVEMNTRLIEFADTDVFAFDRKHYELYENVRKNVPSVKLFISLDNTSNTEDIVNINDILNEYQGPFDKDPDPDTVCAIVFTSGTTGFPKGVMSTHRNYIYSAASVHVACPTTRMFCCLPIHHSFCFTGNITKSICRGKTVCVNDSLANLVADLQLFRPDSILAVPQLVKKVMFGAIKFASMHPEIPEQLAIKKFLGGNIIDIISGGAPLEASLNEKFNSVGQLVLNGYGMTECSPIISNNAVGCFRHGSVGKPIPCIDVKIENGEILVKGPSVMKGYYKNPEATKEAFTDDGYLHTGDLGHFDEDGFLYVTGRCKNLILLDNGENVSAEMLEAQFANEAMVSEVVCYNDGSAICAEVYLNKSFIEENHIEDKDKAMLEVLERVNKNLASYQRISAYLIREIPFERTSSQKIKRIVHKGKALKREIIAPETPAEKKIVEAVKEQLMLNEVSITDNFFALGGDSLGAIELSVTLNIPAQTIYDRPFLRSLAKALEENENKHSKEQTNINEIIKETSRTEEKAAPYKCALLTGATGFLGVHIFRELIEREIKVYCLVRNEEKLKNQLEYYFGNKEFPGYKAVIGDIEKKHLGLAESTYEELCSNVDVIFHTAANVHHAGDYADLERTNVTGTKNIIEFASDSGAVLQHTSTVSVHGAATVKQKYGKKILDENVLDIGQHYEDNVYIHSKYCAEEAVINARLDGVKSNIYRMGNLTWRKSDGRFQKNSEDNGFLHRVHAMLKLGMYNDNMDKYPTDLTAVDECAEAYVNLAFNGEVNNIYHLYNQNFLDTQDMFRFLGVPYRKVSSLETVETVYANAKDRDIHVYMFYLIISGRSRNIEMNNDFTVEKLKETGFEWSVPGKEYLTVSDSPERPYGYCLDYEKTEILPMRKTGEVLNPVQKLTLGVMRDAVLPENKLFTGKNSVNKLYRYIVNSDIKKPFILTFGHVNDNYVLSTFIKKFPDKEVFSGIKGEPSRKDADNALIRYIDSGCDSVIAIGGGSVLDTAKILALRAANPYEDIDDICRMDSDCNKCVPLFAIPTTSGTGSEVTVFSVLTDDDENKKKPFVSDKFEPQAVALDPTVTYSVSPSGTAYTGIDALSHAVESYISGFSRAFPEDREYSLSAADKIFRNLTLACHDPLNEAARENMQNASYEAGLAFRRAGTGYIHAIAHRIGEFYKLPHGKTISAVFTRVLNASMPCCAKPLAELSAYCGISSTGDDTKDANAFIAAVERLIADAGIDNSDIKIKNEDIEKIVLRTQDEAKLMGCPRHFSDDEVREILYSIK